MARMRYEGILVKVHASGKWGFIDRKSIKNSNSEPVALATTKDIYLHEEDCNDPLIVGRAYSFDLQSDERRSNAFRSYNTRINAEPLSGIDLHIDEKYVENPSVGIRWCLSGDTHKRMVEGLKEGKGYAYMLVAKNVDDNLGFREIREIKSWKQVFSILTFTAPGKWDVCVFLYEWNRRRISDRDASSVLEQELRSKLLPREHMGNRSHFERPFCDLHEFVERRYSTYSVSNDDDDDNAVIMAGGLLTVDVPTGIFAKEVPKELVAFAKYFSRKSIEDQCALRRRLGIMFIVGWIPWLLIETGKRVAYIVLGIVGLLFLVKDWWKICVGAFKPAINARIPDYIEGQYTPFNNGEALYWFTPFHLICYFTVAGFGWRWLGKYIIKSLHWLNSILASTSDQSLQDLIVAAVVLAAAGIILALLIHDFGSKKAREARYVRIREREKRYIEALKEADKQNGLRQAALAERQTAAIVCGDTPAQVSLKAIPSELRTSEMWFAAFKQKVCRPFAR